MRRGKVARGDLYEAILDDAAYTALPSLVAKLVGGRSSGLQQFDANGRPLSRQFCHFSDQLIADLGTQHPHGPDVWTQAGISSGILKRAVPMDELVPEPTFRRSTLWNEVLRPHGDDTGHSVGFVLPIEGTILVASVHRAFGAGAFGVRHAARLDALGVDLHRIYAARRLLSERDDRIDRLTHLLEGADAKVLLVGADLRLIEVSPGARALLDSADGLAVRGGRLVVADATLAAELRRAVDRTVHRTGAVQATFVCERPSGGCPWRLSALPAVVDGTTYCLITLSGGQPRPDRLRLWLTLHYGATDAEARVAEALMEGGSPEKIAALRGVSVNTVRTQVRQLLEKTGTRRVTELLLLMARIM